MVVGLLLEHGERMTHEGTLGIQAKVTIQDIEPPIWRRLLLPCDLNLAQLHEVLQAAFGWTDSHLHQFIIGGLVYGAPEFDEGWEEDRTTFEASEIVLGDFDLYHEPHPRILYEYDFGDSWMHVIEFERQVPREAEVTDPHCIDGARHHPPEDVGGSGGYADFLAVWGDPGHEDYADMRSWAGRGFDPEAFDIAATNEAIDEALRRGKCGYRFRLE